MASKAFNQARIDPTWPELPDGEHPLTELLGSNQGSYSPFGDLEFPLENVPYEHPVTEINRQVVAGLLLAGGAGRRMGGPKALVRFRGVRLGTLAVRALDDAGCSPLTVVLGARAADVDEALRADGMPADARTVVAPDWDEGMGASLRRGLDAVRALDPVPSAVLVHLVDLPGVTADAIRRCVESTGDDPSVLCRAAYDGRPGHPVLLGREHWDAVADAASGDAGARSYLGGNPAVRLVECGDLATPDDVDTPEQLERLARGPRPAP